MIAIVEVGGVTGEPGIFDADGIVGEQSYAIQSRALSQIPNQLKKALPVHVNLDQDFELQTLFLRRSRLDMRNYALEIFDRL